MLDKMIKKLNADESFVSFPTHELVLTILESYGTVTDFEFQMQEPVKKTLLMTKIKSENVLEKQLNVVSRKKSDRAKEIHFNNEWHHKMRQDRLREPLFIVLNKRDISAKKRGPKQDILP
jgi:hypothetical protein